MDRLHHDMFNALDALSCADDRDFPTQFGLFVSTAERLFRKEEVWMDDLDYPGLPTHQEEHARVLGALHHVHAQVMDGDTGIGRQVVNELMPQWLLFHITTMDSPFALAMQLGDGAREPALHAS
ncbi:MAG TPA: hemerythrin family protein [Verrucomicrobiae bacterium]|uniref:bacteriohemerythrin n=1 Tax=Noviherbaspirillum sp. TaxID=1926288 RepID=UPI002D485181|nr:hemerythrin family protein [Noviherbaspirillum sp.]HYG22025.1 hemerythrin family protein [Verrucomicrobiae bacterium]HZW22795.1 hemerythrin family protein [Noviherbaspirillum sp.]